MGCPHCRELEHHERIVRDEIAAIRDGLRHELPLDKRLDLVAEEHLLQRLLDRIEERRFAAAS